MKQVQLVVSNDTKTWDKNNKIIFGGQWCFNYDETYLYKQDIDYLIHQPEKRSEEYFQNVDKNWNEIFSIKEDLFDALCFVLNSEFKKNYSNTFYRSLLGYWFGYAIELIYARINFLSEVIKKNNVNQFTYLASKNYVLTPYSTLEFTEAQHDDRWQQLFAAKIIRDLYSDKINTKVINDHEISKFNLPTIQKNKPINYLINTINSKISEIFTNSRDALIIGSYLSLKDEINLKLRLKQVPTRSRKIIFNKKINIDFNLRENIKLKFLEKINNSFTHAHINIYVSYLIDLFPLVFLEGFDEINEFTEKMNWPKNPKFIFTSAGYYCDEVFKLWTAKKQAKGHKYIIGQHGNNWEQTTRIGNNVTGNIEEYLCNKFICSGKGNSQNKLSGFNFKFPKKNSVKHNPEGKISIIFPPTAFYGYRKTWSEVYWDNFLEYSKWRENMLSLINSFNPIIKDILCLKPYDRIKELNHHNEFWKNNLPKQIICDEKIKIKKYYENSRIVIICYDSSSILETFSQNIPTILLFDQYMLRQVKAEYKEFYNELYEAGLLYTDMKKIHRFLEENHDNIEDWWKDSHIQSARKKFSNRFSRAKKNPIKYLSNLLIKESI